MLKQLYRLPKSAKVLHAESIHTPFVSIKKAQNGLSHSRFAFVVSKKVDKRAVVRNKVKRTLRSFIEYNIENIVKGYDMILIAKAQIQTITKEALFDSLRNTFKNKNSLI